MKSTSKNLICRNGKFQFFVKIPTDLIQLFNGRVKIQKSLRTSNEIEANKHVSLLRDKIQSQFLFLRSGLLTEDQKQTIIDDICRKNNTTKMQVATRPKILSDIVKLYIEEKTSNWKARTKLDNESAFKRIVTMLGDLEVNAYQRSDIVKLRSNLLREGLSERTCNRHIGLLSSLLRWATRHSHSQKNVAESLLLDIPRQKDLERKRFDNSDIQTILDSIPLIADDETRIWIPLIALYSGMRREEICQLQRSDIRLEKEVWIFDIKDGFEQSVKTIGSRRIVPVHSQILKLGFIEFCDNRAIGKKDGNLWGFNRWRQTWGKSWGGWFNRWYSATIRTEGGKCFHSFRHTMADELKQAGEHRELVAELLGHVVNDMTFGRYGKRYSIDHLKNAIEKLVFNIDLSRMESILEAMKFNY